MVNISISEVIEDKEILVPFKEDATLTFKPLSSQTRVYIASKLQVAVHDGTVSNDSSLLDAYRAVVAGIIGNREYVRENLTGWENINDEEGKPIPFSLESLNKICMCDPQYEPHIYSQLIVQVAFLMFIELNQQTGAKELMGKSPENPPHKAD